MDPVQENTHQEDGVVNSHPSKGKLRRKFHRGNRFNLVIFTAIFAVAGVTLLALSFAAKPEETKLRGVRGEVAIERLGNRLPAVAQKNGFKANELRELFLNDSTLELDDNDELLYVEPGISEEEEEILDNSEALSLVEDTTETSDGQVAGAITVDDAFNLSSNPDSDKTIFLDFDGHVTEGTNWNSSYKVNIINSVAFDTDGNRSSFSPSERQTIIDIWKSIAEDFSPYFINVTTKDPGVEALKKTNNQDSAYGVRVVISPTNWYLDATGSKAGGIAYISSFTHSNDTPVYSFICCTDPKPTAEVSSHEVGHALGLRHDGTTSGVTYYTGHGDWAPIMGNPYRRKVTHFSKGEYNSANNTEDDLRVMLGLGVTAAKDEAGSTTATAAPLKLNGTTPNQLGVIGLSNDIDVYSFSWPGGLAKFEIKSSVESASFGTYAASGNLDPAARLLNSSGQALVDSDPAGMVPVIINSELPAGTYYLEVRGTGYLSPLNTGYSSYGSIGGYSISGSELTLPPAPVTNQPPVAKLTASTTSGLAPLTVNFSSAGSSDPEGLPITYRWDFGNGTTSTAANASATFTNPGSYLVSLTVTDSSGLTASATTTINAQTQTQSITIASLTGQVVHNRKQKYATIEATVLNSSGKPVSGVAVNGTWSGQVTGSSTAITDGNGKVTISSKNVRKSGDVTFTITSLTYSSDVLNYTWDGNQKSVTIRF